MDHLVTYLIAENTFHLTCPRSFDALKSLRTIVDKTASKWVSLIVKTRNAFSFAKDSPYSTYPWWQEATTTFTNCNTGSGIDNEFACRFERIGNPMFAAGESIGNWQKERADFFCRIK